MALLDVMILLAVVITVAYFNTAIWVWTLSIATTLILISIFGKLGLITLVVFWFLFLFAATFTLIQPLRLKYFSTPLINKVAKNMPAISATEREAIEAGDVWWEKELFCGRPRWKELLSISAPKLSTEEQAFIDNQVEHLCGMLNDWQIVHEDHDMPKAVWDYLRQEKFFGMVIPKQYGGLGFSALAHSTVVVKIATRSISAAVNTMVPNSLGPGELIRHYGTDEQKNHYLPRLARGKEMPCFALTGPEAGSDAGSITDTGIVCRDQFNGEEVIGIRLSWDKRYITLAPVATVLGLAFKLYDPDHILGQQSELGITLCLLPTSHPGVEVGERHWPMYLAFMNGPTRGKDVFIPLDWIIGGPARIGQGWRMLMECLSTGRAISLPALSTACGKLSYRMAGAYAKVRRQFNTSIANFEGIEESLGYIAGYTYQLEATRLMTAHANDLHIVPSIVSAISKYHMTEMARIVTNHAMDIHAGHAVQAGPRNVLAPAYMALPVSITVEGANILTRNLIIFGQGAIRCHPYILKEVALFASTDPKRDVELDRVLLSHIGYFISNLTRAFWSGLTGGLLIWSPRRGVTAKYYRQLSRMSAALALMSDAAMMILGGALKRKERISARLGDILSELYLASTILKYYEDQGSPDTDVEYVAWCIETCLFKIQVAFSELRNNFKPKWIAVLLHAFIFPWGTSYRKPSDALTRKIVEPMLEPTGLRDRITRYCYVSQDGDNAVNSLETAFTLQDTIDPLLQKLSRAIREKTISNEGNRSQRIDAAEQAGIFTTIEAETLRNYTKLESNAVRVNDFTFDLNDIVS